MTRVGQVFKNFQGEEFTIIEYFNCFNCTVKFSSGHIIKNVQYHKSRNVKNPYFQLVSGKGYVGEGNYIASGKIYSTWTKMLERCYCENIKLREKSPTYYDCTVSEEFFNFQNFANWYTKEINKILSKLKDFEQLPKLCVDKDLLIEGNRIYSQENCLLIPFEINNMFCTIKKTDNLPLGVSYLDSRNSFKKYFANVRFEKGKKLAKYFESATEAEDYHNYHKEIFVHQQAEKFKHILDERLYLKLSTYKIKKLL